MLALTSPLNFGTPEVQLELGRGADPERESGSKRWREFALRSGKPRLLLLTPQPCSWGQSSDLLSRINLDELMKKDEPPFDFPDTLEGFEYAFNEKGQLRHIKTGEPFVFNYREDLHRWNQKRYEALGEIITKYVYELLEKDCHLQKISIPVSPIFNNVYFK
ncbi:hypothetical protein NN561_006412 [Cricetulus griseus]